MRPDSLSVAMPAGTVTEKTRPSRATGRALDQLGFRVRWVLIEAPGRGRDVETPPADTVVISVLGPEGEWTDVDPDIDTLMVEIAAPAVADELGH